MGAGGAAAVAPVVVAPGEAGPADIARAARTKVGGAAAFAAAVVVVARAAGAGDGPEEEEPPPVAQADVVKRRKS